MTGLNLNQFHMTQILLEILANKWAQIMTAECFFVTVKEKNGW